MPALGLDTLCCGCIKYICCLWFEQFGCLYFVYCAWAGFGSGEAREEKLQVYYCLRAIQHVTWYMHTLLACYLQASRKISRAIHMQVFKQSCTAHTYVHAYVCMYVCICVVMAPFKSIIIHMHTQVYDYGTMWVWAYLHVYVSCFYNVCLDVCVTYKCYRADVYIRYDIQSTALCMQPLAHECVSTHDKQHTNSYAY